MADRESALLRHKAERKELLATCQRLKHSVPKGDKKRKKEVMEQVAKLESELDDRHEKELLGLTSDLADSPIHTEMNAVSKDMTKLVTKDEELSMDTTENIIDFQQQVKKPSKAQKRRDKKSTKEREREERLKAAEVQNLQGPRHQEMLKLQSLLAQRGLKIYQIPSDGNCMYNAIKHQLSSRGIEETNESLRKKTAELMLLKMDEFLPFLTHNNTGDQFTQEEFEHYCTELANKPAWGGHLELRAVSEALSIPMEVVQSEGPVVKVGENFSGELITLVYQRHAFSLGEHYNSVAPKSPDDDDEDETTR